MKKKLRIDVMMFSRTWMGHDSDAKKKERNQTQIVPYIAIIFAVLIAACTKEDTSEPTAQKIYLSEVQTSSSNTSISYNEKGSVIAINNAFGQTVVSQSDANDNPLELRYIPMNETKAIQKKLFEYDTQKRIIKESMYDLGPQYDTTQATTTTTYTYTTDSVIEVTYVRQSISPLSYRLLSQKRMSIDGNRNVTSNAYYYKDNQGKDNFETASLIYDNALKSPLSLVKSALVIRGLDASIFRHFFYLASLSQYVPKEIQATGEQYDQFSASIISYTKRFQIQIVPSTVAEGYPASIYVRWTGESIVQRTGEKRSTEIIDSVKLTYIKK